VTIAPVIVKGAARRSLAACALAGVILGLAGAGFWNWKQAHAITPSPVVRFNIDLPEGRTFRPTWNSVLIFSPDGGTLAYSTRTGMIATTFLRPLDAMEVKPLTDAPGLAIPVWYPFPGAATHVP
jgi:hypothetical protein